MFPFWNTAIAPILEAAESRRLVEVGALRGENTQLIVDRLGPDTELHVIDPVPDFDPEEHAKRFGGQYIFHRDLSLNVLGDLPPMDAALIDGDHNWYTVYNELRLLREVARANDAPLPILMLHDVGWPYGKRDLYYNPDDIPPEFRQPYRRAGMGRKRSDLMPSGGLNPTMFNAEHEGGPRNGVRTALDDFLAEHDRPYCLVVLPIYFGLAIVVEQERLDRQPAVKAELDRLRSAKGRSQLLHLAEDTRLKAMMFQHNVFYQRDQRVQRATARYLKTVKAALLDEHYLENESRLAHLTDRMAKKRPADVKRLRDPVRQDRPTYSALVRQRLGPAGPEVGRTSFIPYTDMGRTRLDHLERCLDAVLADDVVGDLVECGTGRGGGAIFMRAWLDGHEVEDRRVWVADQFRASPEPDKDPTIPPRGVAGFRADLNMVRDGFDRFDLLDDRVRFLVGRPSATLPEAGIGEIAVLRIGQDLGSDAGEALGHLYDHLAPGAFVIVEDDPGGEAQRAVDAFWAERGLVEPLEQIDAHARSWRKADQRAAVRKLSEPRSTSGRLAAASTAGHRDQPKGQVDLTVVAVFYNMRREAERTLRSLSRSYQEGIDDVGYEVMVVDNGSSPDQRLDRAWVESFGPEFRLIDMGEDADPSPVRALNAGIKAGQGAHYALMIDGAHVLTPGVLRFGLVALETYAPAIVATQQWYTGPGQQGDAMDDGYDQAYEDRLFEEIGWPQAGYRLFEIGHFIGERDWLDGFWESNCLFVSRAQIEQAGGFDEGFTVPGGGYANLELYERLGASPDVTVTSILGEGSFHQMHGGTTTNQVDPSERRRRVFGYGEEYAKMRGRAFQGPGKPIHYVGRITSPSARRTRPRRLSAEAFAQGAADGGIDGRPTSPTPVPDELTWSFTEAVWRSLPWAHTSWLGHAITSAPTDLLAYHEMINRVRPDWIVETGTKDGGRTLFLASMCDLVGHGSVVSVDPDEDPDRPAHPRITYVRGRPYDNGPLEEVRGLVGDGRALLILGSCTDRHKTKLEFDAYAPLVPVGSYVVVTDTIVGGHPVWTAFGPGPSDAVKQILALNGDFVADPAMEKHSLTFNPGGFLHRVG